MKSHLAIADFQPQDIKCDALGFITYQCLSEVTHVDFTGRWRLWCEAHTPWSSHYEDHMGNVVCDELMAQLRVRIDQLMETGWVPPWVQEKERLNKLTQREARTTGSILLQLPVTSGTCTCINGCKSATCDKL